MQNLTSLTSDQVAEFHLLQQAVDSHYDALLGQGLALDDLLTGWLLAKAVSTSRRLLIGWVLIVDGESFFMRQTPKLANRHLWTPVYADIAAANVPRMMQEAP